MLRPNPPRMITVLIAVALLVIGLSWTVLPIPALNDFLAQNINPVLASYGLPYGDAAAYWFLLASPVLLIIGSLFPGI